MSGSKIRYRTASEGPTHDPYHVEYYTLTRGSGAVTELRVGSLSGLSVRHNGVAIICDSDEETAAKWLELTGLRSMHDVDRIMRRAAQEPWRKHARKCGSKDFACVDGYPGETFTVCARCGAILDSHFDRSVIE